MLLITILQIKIFYLHLINVVDFYLDLKHKTNEIIPAEDNPPLNTRVCYVYAGTCTQVLDRPQNLKACIGRWALFKWAASMVNKVHTNDSETCLNRQ